MKPKQCLAFALFIIVFAAGIIISPPRTFTMHNPTATQINQRYRNQ